ncbi:hypothetical protein AB4Z29_18575 [Paenibacillus sp. 2TAB23]|uniref:hypothetical protein n=1 Tax=Paenibacillus sp. 2TAB23 TaxID=3233004 RepID=UPI003F99425C
MNVFLLNSEFHGARHVPTFLRDHYVGFEWPGIGDLEQLSKEAGQEKVVQACDQKGAVLLDRLLEIGSFVYDMQDGDYLFLADGDHVHMGDLGDYYYVDRPSEEEAGLCHRRGVTWLKSLLRSELHPELKSFVDRKVTISMLERKVTPEQIEHWLDKPFGQAADTERSCAVDQETITLALDILRKAMRSGDADRRERAAIAVLQFAKP